MINLKISLHRPAILKFLIPILVLSLGVIVAKSNLLRIEKVNIDLKDVNCVESSGIQKEVNLAGRSLFLLKSSTIAKQLISQHPCIKQVLIKNQFQQVNIVITGRTPFARVEHLNNPLPISLVTLESSPSSQTALLDWSIPKQASGEVALTMDSEGVIYSDTNYPDLTLLFLQDGVMTIPELKVGTRLNKDLIAKVWQIADYFKGASLKLIDHSLLVGSEPLTAFNLDQDINKQLISLQLILQTAKIDGKGLNRVDLRFDKPVLIWQKTK